MKTPIITPKANSSHSVSQIKMKKLALYLFATLFPLLGNSCFTMFNEMGDHPSCGSRVAAAAADVALLPLYVTVMPIWAIGDVVTRQRAPGKEPVIKEGAEVTLDGKLEDDKAGTGGQSTDRVLKYATKSGQNSIEVDCSALESGKIPKGAVRVTGKVIKKANVKRGPKLILKAAKVEKQS